MGYIENPQNIMKRDAQGLTALIVLVASSTLIMSITFLFAGAEFAAGYPVFKSYFMSGLLLLMNFIPIFLFMAIVYLLSNKLWLSYISSGSLFITFSLLNKFKLTYRDDPFCFLDLKLVKESLGMAARYDIWLIPVLLIIAVIVVPAGILLKSRFDCKIASKRTRSVLLIVALSISVIIFRGPYFNHELYEKIGDESVINVWSQSQQFQSRGFVYPFIYSITTAKDTVLEGYDEAKAMEDLRKYEYQAIPEDKKVNIVAIMLEAYNDFSKFDTVKFDINPYEHFHQIQRESIHGDLLTNVFAGDTIRTERSFLTGYNNHPGYYRATNSFVWYLKEQGYRTEAMHPIYGWFYNRRNVNTFLGFDSFDYYENKYQELQETFYEDLDFFDFIIEGYEKSRNNHQPYFNFTVTFQNHGPYSEEKGSEEQFLKFRESYDEPTYNIINNYLSGIYRTDQALRKLLDYFTVQDDPTVVVFFGDHNPWLGQNALGYEMLGIDLDLSSVDGFKNYYVTPYVIWGNAAAKKTLDNELTGFGSCLSPNLLMAELFQILGWYGDEYMQYLLDYKKHIKVNNNIFFEENGEYTPELSPAGWQVYNDYMNVEYYYSRNPAGR